MNNAFEFPDGKLNMSRVRALSFPMFKTCMENNKEKVKNKEYPHSLPNYLIRRRNSTKDFYLKFDYLLQHSFKVNDCLEDGELMLNTSVQARSTEILLYLLEKGADINRFNKDYKTPLSICMAQLCFLSQTDDALNQNLVVFETLVRNGASLLFPKGNEFHNLFDCINKTNKQDLKPEIIRSIQNLTLNETQKEEWKTVRMYTLLA